MSYKESNAYALDDLLRVARREHNTKRSWLYVNPLQGKHIPSSPTETLTLFAALARLLEERCPQERVLVIGFAETATAIGLGCALEASNVRFCMTTTREEIPDTGYLFFTESHSHATEQRLALRGLGEALAQTDRVVFAEDEVTTGNTILKAIRAIQGAFPAWKGSFGIVSILNSMSPERLAELEGMGIFCEYLRHIPPLYRTEEIGRHTYLPLETEPAREGTVSGHLDLPRTWNFRLASPVEEAKEQCQAFVREALSSLGIPTETKRILVLGTEEFMYPGLLLGRALEQEVPGRTVRFHATTRSPIDVSPDEDYPLHSRFPLESFYAPDRRTHIYNLAAYDLVLLVTDAPNLQEPGVVSLAGALRRCGCQDIRLLRWRYPYAV